MKTHPSRLRFLKKCVFPRSLRFALCSAIPLTPFMNIHDVREHSVFVDHYHIECERYIDPTIESNLLIIVPASGETGYLNYSQTRTELRG